MITDASWIWLPDNEEQAANTYTAFRRTFEVNGTPTAANLAITADARYELWVNGEWIGHGPARSFPSPWSVDVYDLAPLLRPGSNLIAVLVHHYGIGTFQYIEGGEPGLIASLDWTDTAGNHTLASDSEWRCLPHGSYAQIVPRISCQQGWEEQFDARAQPGSDWIGVGYDDSPWKAANPTRPAGTAPHEVFEIRDIPFLTREPIYPVRLLRTDIVRTASYTWSLNPRPLLNATDLSANYLVGRMFLVTYVYSEHPQMFAFHMPHGTPGEWKLNGERLRFDDRSLQQTDSGVAYGALKAGWNTLLCRMPERRHQWSVVCNMWTDSTVTFHARPDATETSPWLALGPFDGAPKPTDRSMLWLPRHIEAEHIVPDATAETWQSIWERGSPTTDELSATWARVVPPDMIAAADIFALGSSERIVVGATPRVDEAQALVEASADWATIHPSADGNVRLLLDYGRELVGFHAFEVDAPAGTMLDFHDFEFIQRDGRINLCEGMNNSFRYVCREGRQTYRTFVRHGLRYCWVTIRGTDQPVRLRSVGVLMSTYPVAQRGDFDCSDPLLTRIWHAGAHSVRCCIEDTYTDCPTYEQVHWVGDARVESLIDLVANGDGRLSRHSWIQAGRSLDRSPLVEAQVPSSWLTILPAWSFLWMRWAHEYYMLTGDDTFGAEALPLLSRNVAGIEQHLDERGLFQINAWNMFDWAPLDTPADGTVTHLNCLAVLGLRQTAELARLLGAEDLAASWEALGDRMATAINTFFWDESRNAYRDCIRYDGELSPVFSQQTQTAAFLSGVAAMIPGRAERCRAVIDQAPEGFVTAGSPFFMCFVLETLAREGDSARLVQTIRDYWGIQIEAGATTFWEMYYPTQERHTRSHCHGWSAAPTFFLTQQVTGVRPLTPGYKTILVRPEPGDLRWAHGRVPTPAGDVECWWRKGEETFELRLESPIGVPVRIELPYTGEVTITEGTASPDADSDAWLSEGGLVRLTCQMREAI